MPGDESPVVSVTATPAQLMSGAVTTLSASGSDPDGGAVSYLWSGVGHEKLLGQLPLGDSTVNQAEIVWQAPTVTVETRYTFSVTVTDDDRPTPHTANANVTVVVTPNVSTVTGTVIVAGTARDANGLPIGQALVRLYNDAGFSLYTATNSAGEYAFTVADPTTVTPGQYYVVIERDNYTTQTQTITLE
jgi:uncharacterized protein YqiB (DUF1249 family)